MTKDKLVSMAERNLKKAKDALKFNYDRPGSTEQERKTLKDKVEYNQIVYDMICNM